MLWINNECKVNLGMNQVWSEAYVIAGLPTERDEKKLTILFREENCHVLLLEHFGKFIIVIIIHTTTIISTIIIIINPQVWPLACSKKSSHTIIQILTWSYWTIPWILTKMKLIPSTKDGKNEQILPCNNLNGVHLSSFAKSLTSKFQSPCHFCQNVQSKRLNQ